MDSKQLEAMRAAAATRARSSDRTSSPQVVNRRKAGDASARVERSSRMTKSAVNAYRAGGRSGSPRKLEPVE